MLENDHKVLRYAATMVSSTEYTEADFVTCVSCAPNNTLGKEDGRVISRVAFVTGVWVAVQQSGPYWQKLRLK